MAATSNRALPGDEDAMRLALDLARRAERAGEVPVGAVLLRDAEVLGSGHNRCVERASPLAHAEMEALHDAFTRLGEGRVPGAVLYCTLEPCFMCAGALLHARVSRIVYGARDPKFGACGSLARLPSDPRLNHRCPVTEGVLAEASAELMRAFFRRLR